jgi:hypothetical protein
VLARADHHHSDPDSADCEVSVDAFHFGFG